MQNHLETWLKKMQRSWGVKLPDHAQYEGLGLSLGILASASTVDYCRL